MQNALPGQSAIAIASEFDQFNKPFPIADPSTLVWSSSDPNISVAPTGDGTASAKVTIGEGTQPGNYTVTFADPAAPSLTVTAAIIEVGAAVAVATTGTVDLGAFA